MPNDNDFPRLRYSQPTWILAYDQDKDMVLKGGLGALGVGQMWMKPSDKDREELDRLTNKVDEDAKR